MAVLKKGMSNHRGKLNNSKEFGKAFRRNEEFNRADFALIVGPLEGRHEFLDDVKLLAKTLFKGVRSVNPKLVFHGNLLGQNADFKAMSDVLYYCYAGLKVELGSKERTVEVAHVVGMEDHYFFSLLENAGSYSEAALKASLKSYEGTIRKIIGPHEGWGTTRIIRKIMDTIGPLKWRSFMECPSILQVNGAVLAYAGIDIEQSLYQQNARRFLYSSFEEMINSGIESSFPVIGSQSRAKTPYINLNQNIFCLNSSLDMNNVLSWLLLRDKKVISVGAITKAFPSETDIGIKLSGECPGISKWWWSSVSKHCSHVAFSRPIPEKDQPFWNEAVPLAGARDNTLPRIEFDDRMKDFLLK